ncbi:hypothetical protein GCM10010521_57440 [Streptomyces rameus]|uniref:Secreted protein n=1 Tax=Streptomyces rameus TaxID=68261 RepID=A0ABP6HFV2_9ACTN
MNTGLRITVFAAALAATFGTAFGVGGSVGELSPAPKSAAHDGHAAAGHEQTSGGHEAAVSPGGLQVSQAGYTLDLKTPLLEAGEKSELRFAVVHDGTGHSLTAYQREHGKELHLILASRDLTVYRHLHPTRASDGTWSTPVELSKAGSYRVFADFKPEGGAAVTLGTDLAAAGTYKPAALPEHNVTADIDGYEVKLKGDLIPGRARELTLTVTKDGKPVQDLQPYLGAYGHLVALRSGDLAYLHVHPNGEPGDGKTQSGPEVSFTATAPSVGAYRLFLDFQHQGKVRTAAFTVHASAAVGESGKPSPAQSDTEEAGHAH